MSQDTNKHKKPTHNTHSSTIKAWSTDPFVTPFTSNQSSAKAVQGIYKPDNLVYKQQKHTILVSPCQYTLHYTLHHIYTNSTYDIVQLNKE